MVPLHALQQQQQRAFFLAISRYLLQLRNRHCEMRMDADFLIIVNYSMTYLRGSASFRTRLDSR